jgi:hypothetical protein
MKKIKQILDFAATHPDAVITYHASDMVLARHRNASYLSKSNARSRAGGHFFMSKNVETPPNNGAVFTILQIIKAVMSLAAEAKIGALYMNCHEAVPARHVLEFMGHKQPPTPMQTDNTTALGVVNKNVMKKLKSMDMKYHWLRCRISQMQFKHYWAAGSTNLGDYFTKHHPTIHHQTTRGTQLMWLSGRPTLSVAKVGGSVPAKCQRSLLKPIRLVAKLVQLLTNAWFLRNPMSSPLAMG